MKLAGIELSKNREGDSAVAFISEEETKTFEVGGNEEIAEMIEKEKPDLVAVDSGMEDVRELTDSEEELQEEGFIFTAAKDDRKRVRRFQDLEQRLRHRMTQEEVPEFIRFSPMITSRELAIDGDDALESYSVETSDIGSAKEFDAVLGAVTARFHQQGQSRDLGVVVPQPLGEKDSKNL